MAEAKAKAEAEDEFELVRQMRIDFHLFSISGSESKSESVISRLMGDMRKKVKKLLESEKTDMDCAVHDIRIFGIVEGECEFAVDWGKCWPDEVQRRFNKGGLLRDGNPNYIVIRGPTLDSFLHRYGKRNRNRKRSPGDGDGDDSEDKFEMARRYLINELNCTLFPSHLVITHLHPSQDARLFLNLNLNHVYSSSTQLPPRPTLLLKGLPDACFCPSLQNFLHSLAKIRDIRLDETKGTTSVISIEFNNYKQCYKALKKLCSYTLRNKKDMLLYRIIYRKAHFEYQLTLKDNSLVSSAFDEVLAYKCNSYKAYNESATTQALNNRVLMLEKEFNLVKYLTEENSKDYDFKGSSRARALDLQAAMLAKRLDFVKYVMEDRFGAADESPSSIQQALRDRVSMLDKELSTIKAVLKDAIIGRVQALEIQVATLTKELNTVKDIVKQLKSDVGHNEESPMDGQALKRCKRLRRD